MFHCNGCSATWALTEIGGTNVCLRDVRGDAIWQQLRQHGVTQLNAAPNVVSSIETTNSAGPLTRSVLIDTAARRQPHDDRGDVADGLRRRHEYGLNKTRPDHSRRCKPLWVVVTSSSAPRASAPEGPGSAGGERDENEEMTDAPEDRHRRDRLA